MARSATTARTCRWARPKNESDSVERSGDRALPSAEHRFSTTRASARVVVRQHALGDFLEGHGEVVLRARLHQRRRIVVEGALTELVVIVVDLPGTLR